MRILIDILIVCSLFFAFAGTVGILRMPDTFSRMQSSTNIATLGVIGVILGAIIYAGVYLHDSSMIIKLIVLGLFYIITNPISGHAICRGAYKHGVAKKVPMACDKYGEDMVDES